MSCLSGSVVRALDWRSRDRGFDSRPVCYRVTTLGQLFTPMCFCHQAVLFGTGQRAVTLCTAAGKVTVGLASHWPCVTDSVVYPSTGSMASERELSTPPTPDMEYTPFIFIYLMNEFRDPSWCALALLVGWQE